MKESSWEASRQRQKKKALLLALIGIPAVAAAVVLVVNNRDLINPSGGRNHVESTDRNDMSPQERNDPDAEMANDSLPFNEPAAPEAASNDPQPSLPPVPSDSPAAVASPSVAPASRPSKNSAPDPEKQVVSDVPKSFSITLPPIPCRLESRKDLVIYLSLELFFNEIEKRTDILFRREGIKVIVMRSVKGKELAEMKIGELESQLLHDINRLFEHPDIITTLKIRNIQVEKADHR
jgi:hypothetical protein